MGFELLLAIVAAQAPQETPPPPDTPPPVARPVIQNLGKPLRIPFLCTEQDIQAFGMTCTAADPCPVFFQASHLESSGVRLFLTGNLHNGASTMYSMLLMSDDEGKTWTEPHERIKAAGLEQIRFLDFEHGWIGGQTLLAFPRDPFLLITTDGGKTWKNSSMFSEGKVGSIDHFWFDSKANGGLVLDRTLAGETGARWELYESNTGGDSWTLREVSSKPLRLKTPPPREPAWRLRADAATNSHRIERSQGGKWVAVASFLVRVGECKPDEAPLVEPVAPEPEPPKPATPTPGAPKTPPTMKKKQP
jgi:hypothetical protein